MDTKTVTDMNDTDFNALVSRLDAIPVGATPEQAANALFPNDKEGQREYLEQVLDLQEVSEKSGQQEAAGVAAVRLGLGALVPLITKCVVGGLGRAGINEIRTLVRTGRGATAEDRVHAFVRGCIGRVVPAFAKPLARKFSRYIAKLVLRAIL
jgi:hypothetical protein